MILFLTILSGLARTLAALGAERAGGARRRERAGRVVLYGMTLVHEN